MGVWTRNQQYKNWSQTKDYQQCQSEFPNAKDDVLKWCVLNPNIQYSAYVCRGREKPETHLPLNKQESENSFERMFSFFTQTE